MGNSAEIFNIQAEFCNSYISRIILSFDSYELNLTNSVIKNNAANVILHLLNARITLSGLIGSSIE